MSRKWNGWICGSCKERLAPEEVIRTKALSGPPGYLHEATYLADYCGDQSRYEVAYCGPVRHYPRNDK